MSTILHTDNQDIIDMINNYKIMKELLKESLRCYEDNFIDYEVGIMIPEDLNNNWENIEKFLISIGVKNWKKDE